MATPFDFDLDQITGGEVRIKLHGQVVRFYAVFSNRDVAHYERLQRREKAERLRYQQLVDAIETWRTAAARAEKEGKPPPQEPDLTALGSDHPDFYKPDEYERDVFNLLLSVWRKSEAAKPEHERVEVTEDSVRELTNAQARVLLGRLWLRRNDLRVSAPADDQQPAQQGEGRATADAMSTASSTAAPSGRAAKPRGKGRRNSGS